MAYKTCFKKAYRLQTKIENYVKFREKVFGTVGRVVFYFVIVYLFYRHPIITLWDWVIFMGLCTMIAILLFTDSVKWISNYK